MTAVDPVCVFGVTSPPETGSSVSPAAVHHRALHGSRGPTVFTDRHLKGNHVASERERNHYRRELMLLRAKQMDEEEEEMALVRPSLLQEIRSRNRVDAIRRAARYWTSSKFDFVKRKFVSGQI